jgi:hypothetical protein
VTDLAQFSALAVLLIGGFGLLAFALFRLETRIERFEIELSGLRRDLAEEFRQQRKEVAGYVTAIATAINASRH